METQYKISSATSWSDQIHEHSCSMKTLQNMFWSMKNSIFKIIKTAKTL